VRRALRKIGDDRSEAIIIRTLGRRRIRFSGGAAFDPLRFVSQLPAQYLADIGVRQFRPELH
jgi:hypothetical protein